jgi:protein tyrosine/serine phosphatase
LAAKYYQERTGSRLKSPFTTADRASCARNRAGPPAGGAADELVPGPSRPASRRRTLIALIAAVAAILLAVNHQQVRALRDRFIPKRWGVVEEGSIYRSGQLSRHLVKEMLQSHNIRTVVDLTYDDPNDPHHAAELAAIADLGIERRSYPLWADGTGDVHVYARAVSEIAAATRQGKAVLVHCAAGTQRTGGVVALYRLLVQGRSPEFTMAEMRKYKYDPGSSPKLMEYVNAHVEEIAEDLVRDGTIERVPDPLPQLRAP